MSKIFKKILVILLLSIIFILNSLNIVKAISELTEAKIVEVGRAEYHLKYYNESKGMYTYAICHSVGHYHDTSFFPAFCLNRDLEGVGKVESYTVDVTSKILDDKIWRVVKNSYPNKSSSEMGLSADDAFAVTKFAIYCVTGQADVNLYTADEDDEVGQRMLQILRELVDIGFNGTETYKTDISLEKAGKWVEDGEYYSQTFKVSSSVPINYYEIIETTGLENGDIITNSKGQERRVFPAGENFKVKILKSNLDSDKNINIKINVQLQTYPIFYGKTRIPGTQNYVLTTFETEEFEKNINFNVKTNTGRIELTKLDDETNLGIEDTIFELYNSNNELIGTKTTDKEGRISFEGLYQGRYTLKEVKANDNYILNENKPYVIDVNYNKTTAIEIQNKHKKGNLEIHKVDKDNNNIALGNVGFELYSKEDSKLIGTYYTDANGKIKIENLRTGEYLLKEISTNKWYNLAEDTEIKVEWNDTTSTTVEDELKKGQIKVIKVDKDNHEIKIPNVEFEVLDSNNNLLETIRTNEEGEAITQNYPLRDYQNVRLHEIRADKSYKLNDEIKEITLQENQIKTIIVENEKKKGQIKVIKVDQDNNEIKLANVEFNVLDEAGNIVDSLTTDENGEAVSKSLPIDQEYTIKETKTEEKYVLSQETKKVTLTEDQITDITFENEKKKGQIRVIKVDKDNNEVKLANVEFHVLDEEGNIVETLITDEEGTATTKRLPIDQSYTVQETKTDEKYVLSEEAKTVTLEEDQMSDITFENEKIKGKIRIVKVAEESSDISGLEKGEPLAGVKFEIYDEDGNVVDTLTTNEEGIATSKDLEKGKYKIKEIETNKWYLLDENYYNVEIKINKQTVTLNFTNKPGTPDEEIEKTGPQMAQANEEIEYNINVKNTGNVALDSFIWEDEIQADYINVTKMKLGTYNQENTYNLYYKTNLTEDYVLLYEDVSTLETEEIDFSKELAEGEYITGIKLDFGRVDVGFESVAETSIFAKVNSTVKNGDIFENKVTLTGNYKGYNLTKESIWKTEIYKILPVTGM